MLWVGTDDGNVQVSSDGGATWTDVASRRARRAEGDLREPRRGEPHGEGAAYVSFDGHRGDDFTPYVFRTDDFGQTWRSVAGNLPRGGTVNVVREHPSASGPALRRHRVRALGQPRPGRPLAARQRQAAHGARRRHAASIRATSDLIVGTHGRGVFILDDAARCRAEARRAARTRTCTSTSRAAAVQYRIYGHKGNTGHKTFLAPNPPDGALLTYYLKAKPGEKDEVKIVVKDAAGEIVRELKAPKDAGLNRASWDLRHEPPVQAGSGRRGLLRAAARPARPARRLHGHASRLGASSASRTVEVQARPAPQRLRRPIAGVVRRGRARPPSCGRAPTPPTRPLESLKKQLRRRSRTRGRRTTRSRRGRPTAAAKALADKVEPLAKRVSRQTPLGFAGAPLASDPDPLLGQRAGPLPGGGRHHRAAHAAAARRVRAARKGPGRGHCRRQRAGREGGARAQPPAAGQRDRPRRAGNPVP